MRTLRSVIALPCLWMPVVLCSMAIVWIARIQNVEHCGGSAVVQVGSGTPELNQGGGIHGLGLVHAHCRAHVVALLVGRPLAAVTGRAAGIGEELLPSDGGCSVRGTPRKRLR